MKRALLLLLTILACDKPTATIEAPDPPESHTRSPQDGATTQGQAANPSGCPPQFDFAMSEGSCTQDTGPCTYPEARCQCVPRYPCSGAEREFDPPNLPHVWICEFTDPGYVKPDGCPVSPPTAGTRCDKGQACDYTPYCFGAAARARCVGRKWEVEDSYVEAPP